MAVLLAIHALSMLPFLIIRLPACLRTYRSCGERQAARTLTGPSSTKKRWTAMSAVDEMSYRVTCPSRLPEATWGQAGRRPGQARTRSHAWGDDRVHCALTGSVGMLARTGDRQRVTWVR